CLSYSPDYRDSKNGTLRAVNEMTATTLSLRIRGRNQIIPGNTATNRDTVLYLQVFGTAGHTAAAQFRNDVVDEFHIATRQGGIDDVDPVNTGVLPGFQFIHNLFRSTGNPRCLGSEACQVTDGHGAVGSHFL